MCSAASKRARPDGNRAFARRRILYMYVPFVFPSATSTAHGKQHELHRIVVGRITSLLQLFKQMASKLRVKTCALGGDVTESRQNPRPPSISELTTARAPAPDSRGSRRRSQPMRRQPPQGCSFFARETPHAQASGTFVCWSGCPTDRSQQAHCLG